MAINEDPAVMHHWVREVLRHPALKSTHPFLPLDNQALESVFGASMALGFTLWQHLAAFERVMFETEWRSLHSDLIGRFKNGESLCGLATTQLRKPSGPGLRAIDRGDVFLVSGIAPWVCGLGLFDQLIIGFDAGDEIVFAMIDYPKTSSEYLTLEPVRLCTLNGSSTARFRFDKFPVERGEVFSRRLKGTALTPRHSIYRIPELGVAKFALSGASATLAQKPNSDLGIALSKLQNQIAALEHERNQPLSQVDLEFKMADLVRNSIRLWALTAGGSAIKAGNDIARLQLDVLLLDAILQDTSTLKRKAEHLASES